MSRFIAVLCPILLAGCVTAPVVNHSFDGAAVLRYIGDTPLGPGDGIYMVDSHALNKPPQREVYVRPGRREITFNCPGWISVDGMPSTTFKFKANGRYGLFCVPKSPAVQIELL
jgi:hypothetical protein